MDNPQSNPLLKMARELQLKWELVTPYVKNPNRSERAIRTTKNHMISVRAGFHPDCSLEHMDRCLMQIEMTLNIVRPFEHDPQISAYEGLHGTSFNFHAHPIAPVGTKVLTWDAPDHRGSWADHGVTTIYLGPAPNHYRAFEVWVPGTSALRITNTVWWFMHDVRPDTGLLGSDQDHAYPPTKDRPDPKPNGADLIGRAFLEPEIGVCQIIGIGPVLQHHMPSRAQVQRHKASPNDAPSLQQGAHYTLMYTQTSSGEEHLSSVDEILHWIASGPLLKPPTDLTPTNETDAYITTPSYVPVTIQYVPIIKPSSQQKRDPIPIGNQRVSVLNEVGKSKGVRFERNLSLQPRHRFQWTIPSKTKGVRSERKS
jgi:hypothetical protein